MTSPEFLHPLCAFYESHGREMPRITRIGPEELPPTAHRLLVHSGDMTSKLEEHFGERMRLRVLRLEQKENCYRREVVLFGEGSGLPVEYGAIEMDFEKFSDALRGEILKACKPLGAILNENKVAYRSEPRAFLRLESCVGFAEIFGQAQGVALFGRSNRLLNAAGEVLAQIVEVLRPV